MYIESYINWLKKQLNSDLFVVSQEQNIDANDESMYYVVVRQITGSPLESSIELPLQISIYGKDIETIMNFFTMFSQIHNNEYIQDILPKGSDGKKEVITMQQLYTTPQVLANNVEFGLFRTNEIVMWVTLNIFEKVANIKKILIDGEEQKFNDGNLGYQTATHTTRVSGKTLTIQKKMEATTTLSFNMISTENVFGNKMAKIRQGLLSGNTIFDVVVEKVSGATENYKMILKDVQEPFSRFKITNDNIVLSLADFPNEGE